MLIKRHGFAHTPFYYKDEVTNAIRSWSFCETSEGRTKVVFILVSPGVMPAGLWKGLNTYLLHWTELVWLYSKGGRWFLIFGLELSIEL